MHLGVVLTETTARPPAVGQELTGLIQRVSDRRAEVESKRLMIQPAPRGLVGQSVIVMLKLESTIFKEVC
jgi:hypothetical protein